MPPSIGGAFTFVTCCLAKLGKRNRFAEVGNFTPPGQANKSFKRNWQARFLINRIEPAKTHLGGVNSLALPIRLIQALACLKMRGLFA